MSRFLQVFCSLLSSLLIALAIPNEFLSFGSPIIGLFSLFPLYIAFRTTKSLKFLFLLCFLHGSITHILSSFWLGNFMGFAVFTLGASALGTGFFEAFFSLAFYFPKLFAPADSKLQELSGKNTFIIPFRVFWFSAIYVIWEYCKSTGFLAYPWGTLSMTAYKWSFITQIADITGVYGITFLFAFFSAFFGEGVLLLKNLPNSESTIKIFSSYKSVYATICALFCISLIYGSYQLSKRRTPVKTMNTILVQQNRNPNRRQEETNIKIAQKLTEEEFQKYSKNGEKCDLVVWSEAVLSQRFPAGEIYYRYFPEDESLVSFIKKHKTPFIIGGAVVFNDEEHKYGNSALLFDKNGRYKGFYTKMHLVPFAELIPLNQFEFIRKIIKNMIGFSYGWTPGKQPVLFEIPVAGEKSQSEDYKIVSIVHNKESSESVFLSTPICFDDSAHEVCRALYTLGSEVFVNITNDSWSKTKSAEIQHFVVAHYRSIEYRTTTIRSANAGYTVVIDPAGKILADLPLFTEAALSYKVPIYKRKATVYASFGDWLPWSLIILTFIYIGFSINRKRIEEKQLISIASSVIYHFPIDLNQQDL